MGSPHPFCIHCCLPWRGSCLIEEAKFPAEMSSRAAITLSIILFTITARSTYMTPFDSYQNDVYLTLTRLVGTLHSPPDLPYPTFLRSFHSRLLSFFSIDRSILGKAISTAAKQSDTMLLVWLSLHFCLHLHVLLTWRYPSHHFLHMSCTVHAAGWQDQKGVPVVLANSVACFAYIIFGPPGLVNCNGLHIWFLRLPQGMLELNRGKPEDMRVHRNCSSCQNK